jgi:predicted DNA-binding transcriptional regulator YafY
VLRLLSLLQTRRSWSGTELAERVGVAPRTIRRDVDRLRELGYRITATRGALGGYRLEAGSDLPPLLFTGDEAVALALGLRAVAAESPVRGMAETTISVLAKLEQVLPPAVRTRLRATRVAVAAPGPVHAAELIDPEPFAVLALACRDHELVRFRYEASDGVRTSRRVEPVALVPTGRRWYLLAWDRDRADWRTFRLDRIQELARDGVVVPRRDVPGGDAAAFVADHLSSGGSPRFSATVRITAPLTDVEAYIGPYTSGLEADGKSHTLWHIRDDRLEVLTGALTWLVWPFEIVEGQELQRFAGIFAERLAVIDSRYRPGRPGP